MGNLAELFPMFKHVLLNHNTVANFSPSCFGARVFWFWGGAFDFTSFHSSSSHRIDELYRPSSKGMANLCLVFYDVRPFEREDTAGKKKLLAWQPLGVTLVVHTGSQAPSKVRAVGVQFLAGPGVKE